MMGWDCRKCKHWLECTQIANYHVNPKCFDKAGHPYFESKDSKYSEKTEDEDDGSN